MKYEYYTELEFDPDLQFFDFISLGKHGPIRKRIAFIATDLTNVYNMAFGNHIENDKIDDYSISDNGDRNKILATLVRVIDLYTDKYPERWIYFEGSTKGRNRLYRMAIGLNLEELSDKYKIYAKVDGKIDFDHFKKNIPANAFLIKRKIV
jgi:hypothetical protein